MGDDQFGVEPLNQPHQMPPARLQAHLFISKFAVCSRDVGCGGCAPSRFEARCAKSTTRSKSPTSQTQNQLSQALHHEAGSVGR